ncbi:MAG: O-antigen ligase family protein [Burkholderiaceae bacterium]|nr:O-antigen ligase family protein [Burkholderiaceae bacterium]
MSEIAADENRRSWTDFVSGFLLAAWFGYLLFSPTIGFGWIESWHNEQRAAQVVLLAVTALGFAAMVLDPRYRCRLPQIHWIVIAVFALGTISAARAKYLEAAYAEVCLHVLLAILIIVTAAAVARSPKRAITLAQYAALLLLATYVLGVAVRYGAAASLWRPLNLDVLLLGYANPRFPSALHALLIPFAASLAADPARRKPIRAATFFVLACIWAINLALATRAIWFAYAVALPLLWVLLGRRSVARLVIVVSVSAGAGALLYALVFRGLPVWVGFGESFQSRALDQLASGSNRALLIQSSIQAIRSAPWLGIGPMQFAAIAGVWSAHPHNWLLQLASEWGLPAAGLAIWGLVKLFRGSAAALSAVSAECDTFIAFMAASVVALVYGLVDGSLVMPVSQTAAALGLAGPVAAVAYSGPRIGSVSRGVAALMVFGIACVGVAGAIHLGWFAAHSVGPMTAVEQANASRTLWPRFWSDGFLPFKTDSSVGP